MIWFILTNCDNLSSYHDNQLVKGTQFDSEFDLLLELMTSYKKDLDKQCYIEVSRFLETIQDLVTVILTLPSDTFMITDYYRTLSCCRIALYKSDTITTVDKISVSEPSIQSWFVPDFDFDSDLDTDFETHLKSDTKT